MLAAVLAVLSGACLVAGWLLEQIVLVYAALGLSTLGLLLVFAAALRRSRSGVPESLVADEPSTSAVDGTKQPGDAEVAEKESDSTSQLTREIFVERASGDRLDSDATVYVLQRRKRFHTADCRLVRGKQAQELTLVEAREEDFTACSVCVEVGAAALLSEQR